MIRDKEVIKIKCVFNAFNRLSHILIDTVLEGNACVMIVL